jgi:uncharacterized protein (DUF4415 family)
MKQYSAEELAEESARGETLTDWARVEALTSDEIEASIDHEDEGEFDWSTVYVGLPPSKSQLTLRVDDDVIQWFKSQGAGYQTRMNAVLRSYVVAQQERKAS